MLESLSTKLRQIAETARKYPKYQFRTIAHLITVETLWEAYHDLKRGASSGVDGVTAIEYERDLKKNLDDLHRRMRGRQYRAQPLRRVYIEKDGGKKRPLSIPAIEDKIVQKAVARLLNSIYEQDFFPVSYGYRNGRNAHDALLALWKHIMDGKVNYVLEADIQDYFGSIVRTKLMEIIQRRIGEKSILHLIGKWLNAGVIEEGRLLMTEGGIHQGAVISPLLANIYLHEALDYWVEKMVKPVMRGEVRLFRFADDFVVCFERLDDAQRFKETLPKRFSKYGLVLHPEKTKLIEFGRKAWKRWRGGGKKPPTFNFLGFTLISGTGRKGDFVVKRKTMSKRQNRGLNAVYQWCRKNRHRPLTEQWLRLKGMLRGHYAYYAIRTNYRSVEKFYFGVRWIWRKWLGRRSRNGQISWEKYIRMLKRYPLPRPRITRVTQTQFVLFGEVF